MLTRTVVYSPRHAGSFADIQTYDRNGNRVLIGDGEIIQAFDVRTSGTIGVWSWDTDDTGTGWTKDDRDFTDIGDWRAAVDEILARS